MMKTRQSYVERWAPEQVEECCDLWNLSPEERTKLLQLKDKVGDLYDHWKNDPFELTRFLKEFRFDIKTSENKFRHSIQWRLEHNADHILEDYTPPALYNYFPLGVLEGADREGDPIYIERSGAADTLGLLQRFGKEEMIQQAIWGKELMSRGPWQEHWPHGRIKQFVSILDLKGLNRHHLHPALVPVGQAVTRLVQDNYPGIGKRILVIRAPFFFRFVWNIFKHFVDPHVKDLLEIATEEETPALLEKYMDLSVLPKEIVPQGRGRTVQGYESVIWEGGTLPPPSKDDRKRGTPIFPSAAPPPPTPETPKLDTPTTIATDSIATASFSFDDEKSPKTTTTSPATTTTSTNRSPSPDPANPTKPPLPQTPLQLTASSSTEETKRSSSWESIPASSSHGRSELLQTPIQLRMSDGTQDTCMSWESLPQVTPRRNIQQAWTVTPGPYFYDLEAVWSDQNVHDMAQLWNLTQDDQHKMRLLRHNLLDCHHYKNNPYELVRFYKELDGNLDKVEHQFRKMIVWRVENNMDDFLAHYAQPDPLFHYMPICVLKGLDKEGDPIYVDRMGACDYYPLLRHFGPDAMVDYITFLREMNSSRQFWKPYEEHVGHKVKSFTVIIDLEGLNAKHLRPALIALLKRTAKLSQDNYSGWVKRILVIRAPPMFKLVWRVVKSFFAPHVRALIEFSQGGDHLALLDKYVNRDVLPSVICPESDGEVMPGYYQHVRLEGGPIPNEAFEKAKSRRQSALSSTTSSSKRRHSAPGVHTTAALSTPRSLLLAPMPPGSDDDDESGRPSSPVTTTHLLLGHWDDDLEEEEDSKQPTKAERNDASIRASAKPKEVPWQSPMFKYNW